MNENNLLEKLVAVSPGMEIWWDSSPVIFENWCRKLLAKAKEGDKETLKRQFDRMYNKEKPEASLFRGVTTNPSLSLQAIKDDEPYWKDVTFGIIKKNPGIDKESLFWLLYKEVVKRGSDMFLPLFEKTNYREGYLSGQVDPRKSFDKETMLKQATELAAINPNVMIKVPGTKEGYEVIEILTSRGIATNNTLTFVLPQLMDCAKSVQRGLEKAKDEPSGSFALAVRDHPHGGPLRRSGRFKGFWQGKGDRAFRGGCPSGGTGHLQEGLPAC